MSAAGDGDLPKAATGETEADILNRFGQLGGTTPCGVTFAITESGRFITAEMCEPPQLTAEEAGLVLADLAQAHSGSRLKAAVREALRSGCYTAQSQEEAARRLFDAAGLLEPEVGLPKALEAALLEAEAGLLRAMGQGVDRHGRWLVYSALRLAVEAEAGEGAAAFSWVWTEEGVAAVAGNAAAFGRPRPGHTFTMTQLMLARAAQPALDCQRLATLGYVRREEAEALSLRLGTNLGAENPVVRLVEQAAAQERAASAAPPASEEDMMSYLVNLSFGGPEG